MPISLVMSCCSLPITIRRCTTADIDRLVEIGNASFDVDALPTRELLRLRRRCFTWAIAAELEGEIIGYMVTCIELHKHYTVAHIATLAVAPAYRRQGVGSALVNWSFEHVTGPARLVWELEVRPSNDLGMGFWQSFGFVPVGIKPRFYRDKADAIHMRKGVEGEQ